MPRQLQHDQSADLIAEMSDAILARVKETAHKITERIKKTQDDTGETAKLDTKEIAALPKVS